MGSGSRPGAKIRSRGQDQDQGQGQVQEPRSRFRARAGVRVRVWASFNLTGLLDEIGNDYKIHVCPN